MSLPLVDFSDIVTFTRASTATAFGEDGLLASYGTNVPRLEWNPVSLLDGLSVQRRTLTLDRGVYSFGLTGSGSVTLRLGGVTLGTVTSAARRRFKVRRDDTEIELLPAGTVSAWTLRQSRRLLLEGQRTNLLTYSEQFDNAAWFKSEATVLPNTAIAPSGETTADKLVESTNNAAHAVNNNTAVTISAGSVCVFSVLVKSSGRERGRLNYATNSFLTQIRADFDLSAGTISAAYQGFGSGSTGLFSGIRHIADGWYRVWVGGVLDGSSTIVKGQIVLSNSAGQTTYTGDGTSGLYIWGAQLEAGSYPSSYIATTSATVTRSVDANSGTVADYLSAAGNTLVLRARAAGGLGTQVLAQIDDGDENDRARIVRDSSGDLRGVVTVGGVEQCNLDLGAVANGEEFEVAFGFTEDGFFASLNGGDAVTDISGDVPTLTTLRLGQSSTGDYWGGHILDFEIKARPSGADEVEGLSA